MPPVNDAIANATLITLPTSFTYDTTGANTGGGPFPAFEGWPNVWYRIEPAVDVLIGITVEQTGGPATDGPEVDLYHLIGSDPPADYNDIDFVDWAGDGTAGPTLNWQDGPTTYRKLTGGEVYFLDCADWNFADEIITDVTLTTHAPQPNDDWQDAIVINSPGGNIEQVSTIGATNQSFEFPTYPSVWYKIIAQDTGIISLSVINTSGYRITNGYRHQVTVYGPVVAPGDVTDIQGSTEVGQLFAMNPLSNKAAYRQSTEWEPWYIEWLATSGDEFYVQVGTTGTSSTLEGTLTMRVTLPQYTEFAADSGANLDSASVSIVDTDWVRDTQYREFVGNDSWTGDFDYRQTFSVEPGVSGNYALDIFMRYHKTGTFPDNAVCVVRVNGVPVREQYWLNMDNTAQDTAVWIPLTQEYSLNDGWGTIITSFVLDPVASGPRYIQLSPGDILSFDIGSAFSTSFVDTYFEIQKIRLSPAGAYDPLPNSWKSMLVQNEMWQEYSAIGLPGRSLGNFLYLFDDVDTRTTGQPTTPDDHRRLGVWRYELQNGRMVAVDGDLNLGATGGTPTDIRLSPGDINSDAYLRDLTILPNGDIYCIWTEGSYFVMKMWDGATWSLVSDDCSGLGAPYSGYQINHVSIDNDGTDIYFAWGHNKTSGQFGYGAGNGFNWHAAKYDVSGNTITELGTGQTAFSGSTLGQQAGDFDHPPRLKVSPGGVPWVIWCESDPDFIYPAYEEYMWVYYWDGAAWVDAQIPHPSIPPIDDWGGGNTWFAGSPGNEKGNYVNLLTLESYSYDLVFCHHDGPSETPAVLHEFWWAQVFSDDIGTMFYAECNGVGDWANELLTIPGTDFGRDYPNRLPQATDSFSGNVQIPHLGGWNQGLWLDIYQNRPILFTQSGYFGQGANGILGLSLPADGSQWKLLGPGFANDVISPDPIGYSWTDFAQPGCVVAGTPVCWWIDQNSWGLGYWLTAYTAIGGLVSMNWRSSDRRGSANRVLTG